MYTFHSFMIRTQMNKEPSQRVTWMASLDYTTLQGSTTLPVGINNPNSEVVAFIPRKFPDIRLFAYCTISTANLTKNIVLGNGAQTFNVSVLSGLPILLQTARASVTPDVSIAAMNMCSGNLKVEVDNVVTTQGNTINGRIRAGVVNDFSGDIYNEKIISNTTLRKDVVSGGATQSIYMSLIDGGKYHTTRIRLRNESWKQAFDATKVYVMMRTAHIGLIHVTGTSANLPVGTTQTQVNLIIDDGCEGMTIPSYGNPFVDTADASVQVTHVYVSVSKTAVTLVSVPNYHNIQVCTTEPPPNMTWLCSLIYAYGTATPLYSQDGSYAPALECEVTTGVRCAGFCGLTGNTFLLTAEGKLDIPPVLRNPVDIYKHGYGTVRPQPEFLEEVARFNSEDTERERIRCKPLVVNNSELAIWDHNKTQPPGNNGGGGEKGMKKARIE